MKHSCSIRYGSARIHLRCEKWRWGTPRCRNGGRNLPSPRLPTLSRAGLEICGNPLIERARGPCRISGPRHSSGLRGDGLPNGGLARDRRAVALDLAQIVAGSAEEDSAEFAKSSDALGPEDRATRRFNKHLKNHRRDPPQFVLGVAATGEELPMRCWAFLRSTSDQMFMRIIKSDLVDSIRSPMVWVANSGSNSMTNLSYLQRKGRHHVIVEKLRPPSQS